MQANILCCLQGRRQPCPPVYREVSGLLHTSAVHYMFCRQANLVMTVSLAGELPNFSLLGAFYGSWIHQHCCWNCRNIPIFLHVQVYLIVRRIAHHYLKGLQVEYILQNVTCPWKVGKRKAHEDYSNLGPFRLAEFFFLNEKCIQSFSQWITKCKQTACKCFCSASNKMQV